ncbi:Short-chain dehydrogenase/reductase SDR [Venturia nashicola]|nr:Short-chain dehydrogenase/reductase SDR [Venturia nashicola]
MDQIPDLLYSENEAHEERKTWLIIGASRGIGLEFVRQLMIRGERILATVRQPFANHAGQLWNEAGGGHGRCRMFMCDIISEASILAFVTELMTIPNLKIDYVVINAGVLKYPNEFAFHLHTNSIGPIIMAQKLLQTNIPIGTIVFMSSDSGSATNFRGDEDGFGAYAASKCALNQMLRHMAAELKRKDDDTIILAMHPGEVATDMANIDIPWEVDGMMTAEQSVSAMFPVIQSKKIQHSGTFWTWENKVYNTP